MRRAFDRAGGLLLAGAAIMAGIPPALAQSEATGTLASGDATLESGEFYDTYDIAGQAGDSVTITLQSGDFDAYVFVRGPQDSSFSNDDAEGGGPDAALTFTLPADGTYQIFATSYASGETGSYRLTSSVNAAGAVARGSSDDVLAAGERMAGTLAAGDETLEGGEFVDSYTLAGEPGSRVLLTMRSDAFDTYLHVSGDGGYEVFNDDAPGGDGDSQLEAQFPASGRLLLLATSFAVGEQGAYTITVDPVAAAATGGAPLTLGREVTGSLPGDAVYRLEGQAGQTVRLSLRSGAFDPVLQLAGPDGFSASNDDDPAGDTLDSLLEVTLPASGTYHLTVANYSGDGAGAFQLAATAGGQGVAQAGQRAAATLAPGRTVSGSLAAGDGTFASGEYQDRFTFNGRRGDRVVFDMQSADFDTFLSLYLPDGAIETNDDRAGNDGTDSRLAMTLPQDGTYEIAATSYAAAETGGYTLQMAMESGATPPALADAGGAGRVFLLSVGVADYTRANPLAMTDADAAKLTQTLSTMGVLAPGSVTLLNAEATRGAVQAAFGRIAAQIGPDNLFLMFFSGHGSKEGVDTIMEGDGSAETIEMYDAAIRDYELAQLFDQIPARSLLVLDSCFSGGFDTVIKRRTGRMGIFSSDSDLTSLVAEKFQAGGYISMILQQALSGQADGDGNSAITAGELSEYMRSTFYRIALQDGGQAGLQATVHGRDAQPVGSGYQHILVDRGGDGMAYEQVLLRLGAPQLAAR